jgi:hypothetical protein
MPDKKSPKLAKPAPQDGATRLVLHKRVQGPLTPWRIRCYLRESGKNDAEKWYSKLTVKGKARLASRLRYLIERSQSDWVRDQAVTLGDNLAVIHLKDENGSEHRLTGYFDVEHHSFVICVYGFEKDGVYNPPDYVDRTNQCRKSVGQRFDERTVLWPWPLR